MFDLFDKELRTMLDKMDKLDPQLGINGFRNVWIAKPNCTAVNMNSSFERQRNTMFQ